MTTCFGKTWLVCLVAVLFLTSACAGNTSSKQAEVDRAVKATLTAAVQVAAAHATSTPPPQPTATPTATPTSIPTPTQTPTPIPLEQLDLSKALLRPGDVSMGGDYPEKRWVTCPVSKGMPLGVSDAVQATVKRTATSSFAVDACSGFPISVREELLLTDTQRQAERFSTEATEKTTLFLGMAFGAVPSTIKTAFGAASVIEFQYAATGTYGTQVIAQTGPLVVSLAVVSDSRLIAADYTELVEAAMKKVILAQLGA